MKSELGKIMNTLKYALPFAATAFFAQEMKGQQQIFPQGVINPFSEFKQQNRNPNSASL